MVATIELVAGSIRATFPSSLLTHSEPAPNATPTGLPGTGIVAATVLVAVSIRSTALSS